MSTAPRSFSRATTFALHLLCWAGLFFLPILLESHQGLPLFDWIRLTILAAIFYLDYHLAIPRLFLARRWKAFAAVHLGFLMVGHFLVRAAIVLLLAPPVPTLPPIAPPSLLSIVVFDALAVLICTAIALAIRLLQHWRSAEARRQELELEKLRTELDGLKNQLGPHFLFNTLNNIFVLAGSDPDAAQSAIHSLSRMMRYLLYETGSAVVPLRGEVNFLSSFIDLMRIRLRPTVVLDTRFQLSDPLTPIVPLLLLPLVENVFKHGVDDSGEGTLVIHLLEQDGRIQLVCENPNHPQQDDDRPGGGIGLQNVRKRLELAYPGRHSLSTTRMQSRFRIELTLHPKEPTWNPSAA